MAWLDERLGLDIFILSWAVCAYAFAKGQLKLFKEMTLSSQKPSTSGHSA